MEEDILLLLDIYEAEDKRQRRIERRRYLRHLRDVNDPFLMNEGEFKKFFRLPQSLVLNIIEEIQPYDIHKTRLLLTVRFLTALYFFGHGSYHKRVGNHCVQPMSQSSVSRTINEISKLLIRVKNKEIAFPKSIEKQLVVQTGYFAKFGIKSTIRSIDCTHVAIVAPPSNNTEIPLSMYMNRKGYYSINVEAICDHRLVFNSINAKFPGSCHESGIWTKSLMRTHLMRSHSAQRDAWLLGDQGYPRKPWLLTPLAEPHGVKDEKYNKLHTKSRNTIERASGVLKARFRCLSKHRVLHYSHEKAANIIYACAILHNIIIKSGAGSWDFDETEPVLQPEFGGSTISSGTSYFREGEIIRRRYISTL